MSLLNARPASAAAAAMPTVRATVGSRRRWPTLLRPTPSRTSSTRVTESETILAVARGRRAKGMTGTKAANRLVMNIHAD
jgi:hypothetical protein